MPALCMPPCLPSSLVSGGACMSGEGKLQLTEDVRTQVRIALEAEIPRNFDIADAQMHVKRHEEAVYRAAASAEAYFDLLEQMFGSFLDRLRHSFGHNPQIRSGNIIQQGMALRDYSQALPPSYAQATSQRSRDGDHVPPMCMASSACELNSALWKPPPYLLSHTSYPLGSQSSTLHAHPGTASRILSTGSTAPSSLLSSSMLSSNNPITLQLVAPATESSGYPALDCPLLISQMGLEAPRTSMAPQHILHTAHAHIHQNNASGLGHGFGVGNGFAVGNALGDGFLHGKCNGIYPAHQVSQSTYLPACSPSVTARPSSTDSLGRHASNAFSAELSILSSALPAGDLLSEAGDPPCSESGSGTGVENLPLEWQMAREQLLHYQLADDDDDDDETAGCLSARHATSGQRRPVVPIESSYPQYSLQTTPGNAFVPANNTYPKASTQLRSQQGHAAQWSSHNHVLSSVSHTQHNAQSQNQLLSYVSQTPRHTHPTQHHSQQQQQYLQQQQQYAARLAQVQDTLHAVRLVDTHAGEMCSDTHLMLPPAAHHCSLTLQPNQAGVAVVRPPTTHSRGWADAANCSMIGTLLYSTGLQ